MTVAGRFWVQGGVEGDRHPDLFAYGLAVYSEALAEHEDDLQRAVDSQILEGVDLDWKKDFYPGTDAGKKELAKDVCAMANTAGGMVVIGVAGRRITLTVVRISAGLAAQETPVSSALGIPVLAARGAWAAWS
ncbi:AlbA family DNA-binding domain-containing protein [Streptomyces arboris]|uniref:AlbA family DNA-binding domain-containing protein n=1 Tax=Streptomyces arboris TaxID=2600619 RepID=UPI00384EB913